jgi:dTDP-4-amino-4,6-dideoxygalactose transaminase
MTSTDESPLPFALPDITEAEIQAVVQVLRSRWLTTGGQAREFERRFAAAVGAPHAVALNSCTAALHLALEGLGVATGDLVYLPTYTFAASAEVVRYLGATPVLVDVDPLTLNLDTEALREQVTADLDGRRGRPAVIMPVHFSGVPCEMPPLWDLAREHGLAVVEDAAHAFPASRGGRMVGDLPDDVPGAVCFSFYATKTITTGEGGMAVTSDEALATRMRTMSLHGLSHHAWNRYAAGGSWRYDIVAPGYKYNLTDVAAAMGLVQLERATQMRDRRAEIGASYNAAFADLPVELPTVPLDAESAWHLYVLRVDPDASDERDRVIAALSEDGIGTSVHFIPLHLHSYYRETYGHQPGDFPVATAEFKRALSLPVYSAMSDSDVDRVICAVRTAFGVGRSAAMGAAR